MELTKAIQAMSTGRPDRLANQAGDEVDRARHDSGAKHINSRPWESNVLNGLAAEDSDQALDRLRRAGFAILVSSR
jgi:hypothetical protein